MNDDESISKDLRQLCNELANKTLELRFPSAGEPGSQGDLPAHDAEKAVLSPNDGEIRPEGAQMIGAQFEGRRLDGSENTHAVLNAFPIDLTDIIEMNDNGLERIRNALRTFRLDNTGYDALNRGTFAARGGGDFVERAVPITTPSSPEAAITEGNSMQKVSIADKEPDEMSAAGMTEIFDIKKIAEILDGFKATETIDANKTVAVNIKIGDAVVKASITADLKLHFDDADAEIAAKAADKREETSAELTQVKQLLQIDDTDAKICAEADNTDATQPKTEAIAEVETKSVAEADSTAGAIATNESADKVAEVEIKAVAEAAPTAPSEVDDAIAANESDEVAEVDIKAVADADTTVSSEVDGAIAANKSAELDIKGVAEEGTTASAEVDIKGVAEEGTTASTEVDIETVAKEGTTASVEVDDDIAAKERANEVDIKGVAEEGTTAFAEVVVAAKERADEVDIKGVAEEGTTASAEVVGIIAAKERADGVAKVEIKAVAGAAPTTPSEVDDAIAANESADEVDIKGVTEEGTTASAEVVGIIAAKERVDGVAKVENKAVAEAAPTAPSKVDDGIAANESADEVAKVDIKAVAKADTTVSAEVDGAITANESAELDIKGAAEEGTTASAEVDIKGVAEEDTTASAEVDDDIAAKERADAIAAKERADAIAEEKEASLIKAALDKLLENDDIKKLLAETNIESSKLSPLAKSFVPDKLFIDRFCHRVGIPLITYTIKQLKEIKLLKEIRERKESGGMLNQDEINQSENSHVPIIIHRPYFNYNFWPQNVPQYGMYYEPTAAIQSRAYAPLANYSQNHVNAMAVREAYIGGAHETTLLEKQQHDQNTGGEHAALLGINPEQQHDQNKVDQLSDSELKQEQHDGDEADEVANTLLPVNAQQQKFSNDQNTVEQPINSILDIDTVDKCADPLMPLNSQKCDEKSIGESECLLPHDDQSSAEDNCLLLSTPQQEQQRDKNTVGQHNYALLPTPQLQHPHEDQTVGQYYYPLSGQQNDENVLGQRNYFLLGQQRDENTVGQLNYPMVQPHNDKTMRHPLLGHHRSVGQRWPLLGFNHVYQQRYENTYGRQRTNSFMGFNAQQRRGENAFGSRPSGRYIPYPYRAQPWSHKRYRSAEAENAHAEQLYRNQEAGSTTEQHQPYALGAKPHMRHNNIVFETAENRYEYMFPKLPEIGEHAKPSNAVQQDGDNEQAADNLYNVNSHPYNFYMQLPTRPPRPPPPHPFQPPEINNPAFSAIKTAESYGTMPPWYAPSMCGKKTAYTRGFHVFKPMQPLREYPDPEDEFDTDSDVVHLNDDDEVVIDIDAARHNDKRLSRNKYQI